MQNYHEQTLTVLYKLAPLLNKTMNLSYKKIKCVNYVTYF